MELKGEPAPSDEQLRTLWVGGISDQVDEEILFELFLNVSPACHSKVRVNTITDFVKDTFGKSP